MADETSLSLKLWVVLARAFNAVNRHARADQARHGLTEGEFAVLEALYHKGPMLLVEVQRKILVSSGGITYLVDRLASKGLVERRPYAGDRRAHQAGLTQRGERLIADIFPAHARAIRRALEGLDAEQKLQAIELLRTLGLEAEARAPAPDAGSKASDGALA